MIKRANLLLKSQYTHIHVLYQANQIFSNNAPLKLPDLISASKYPISFWNKSKAQDNKNTIVFEYNEFYELYKVKQNIPMNELLLAYTQTYIFKPEAHEIFSAAIKILSTLASDDRSTLHTYDLRMIKTLVTFIIQNYEHHLYFDQMELITLVIVTLNENTIISNEELKSLCNVIQKRLLELSNNKSHFLYFKSQVTKILKNLIIAGYLPAQQIVDLIAKDTLENFKETPNTLLADVVLVQSKSTPHNPQLYNETKLHLLKGSQFYLKERLVAKFTIEVQDKSVRQILRELGAKLLLQSYRGDDIQYQKIIILHPLDFSNLLFSFVNFKDRSSNFASYLQERILEILRENEDIVTDPSDQHKLFWMNLIRFLRYIKTEGIVISTGNRLEEIAWNYFMAHIDQLNLWDYQFLLELLLLDKKGAVNKDLEAKNRKNLLFQLINAEIKTRYSSEITEQQLRILTRIYYIMLDLINNDEKDSVLTQGVVNARTLKLELEEFILNLFQSELESSSARIIMQEKLDEVMIILFSLSNNTHQKWNTAVLNIKRVLENALKVVEDGGFSPLNLLQATDFFIKCMQNKLFDPNNDEKLRQSFQVIESSLNQTPSNLVNEEFSERYFKSYSQAVRLDAKEFQQALDGLLKPLMRFFADKYTIFSAKAFQNIVSAMGEAKLLDINFDDGSQLYDKSIREEIKEHAIANQSSYEEKFVKQFHEEIFKQESLAEKALKFSEDIQKKLS